jgi:hypothetical protein
MELRNNLVKSYYGGAAVNDQNLESGIDKMMSDLEKYIKRLNRFGHPDYNVYGSVEKLLRKTLPSMISLINEDTTSEFGKRFERQLMTFFENIYMVLVKCIGHGNAELFLNEILLIGVSGGPADQELNPKTGKFNRFSRYLIKTYLINRRSYDLSEIQEFLVKKPKEEEPMEVDAEPVELEVEIETTSEPEPQKIEEKVTPEREVVEEPVVDGDVQARDLLEHPLPVVMEGSEPWHAHLPSNWLSIISRDLAKQTKQPAQKQFSDAYISGMSTKRRKMFMTQKSSSNPQQLMSDGLRLAAQALRQPVASSSRSTAPRSALNDNVPLDEILTSISADQQLQQQYRDTIRATINERISQDPDYSSEKFPNCKKMSQQ